jgi:hypothetical protein
MEGIGCCEVGQRLMHPGANVSFCYRLRVGITA